MIVVEIDDARSLDGSVKRGDFDFEQVHILQLFGAQFDVGRGDRRGLRIDTAFRRAAAERGEIIGFVLLDSRQLRRVFFVTIEFLILLWRHCHLLELLREPDLVSLISKQI